MSESLSEALRQRQLAFIGRVSAGFTHEFKNHLAVINESAGLLGDLFAAAKRKGLAVDHDRCLKMIESIGERVAIAGKLAGYVNSFSHRLDSAAVDFSLENVVGELLALIERFARLRKISLVFSPAPGLKTIANYPSLLQFVCYSLLMGALGRLEEGGSVQVSIEQGEAARILIRTEGICREATEEQNEIADHVLQKALDQLSAELVSTSHDNSGLAMVLTVSSLQHS